tara:strand:- start:262 stop:936 length:675 start_codon:yes stop_codon:yes gene_type:complete
MVLPLLPLLPYAGAGIAALSRFAMSPTGQRVAQGGLNLLQKGANRIGNVSLGSIPQYVQSLATGSRFAPTNTSFMSNVVTPSLTAPYLANPKEGLDFAMYGVPYLQESVSQLTGDKKTGIITDIVKASQNIGKEGKEIYEILFGDDETAADVEEELEKELEEEKEKKKKEKKEKKKKEKDDDEKEEPSLDMIPLKKGGYVKKKRKRKPYKPSSFVKMKGRKKYI